MKKKSLNDLSDLRMVFSTNPDAKDPNHEDPTQANSPALSKMQIRVSVDRKHRAGKEVTILEGFELNEMELEDMARKLKNQCGIGGSVKDGLILLQGDQRKKLTSVLNNIGIKKIRVIQ